jgi:hypothetical protein
VHGLIISIPCIFQPAGIVSVAATILPSDGSVIVAVVSWFDNGVELRYVAEPAADPAAAPPSDEAAATGPVESAAADFCVEVHPAISPVTAKIIVRV